MFDNLRQQSTQGQPAEEEAPPQRLSLPAPSPSPGLLAPLLALSPAQRFVLALMVFLNVTVLGCFALIVFEKIALPF